MLLPSAFTCDSSQPLSQQPRARGLLFASPPLSPTPSPSASTSINNLFTTCRALQSMLTTPTQLPSPPIVHNEIPSSSLATTKPSHPKLRLRVPSSSSSTSSKKPAPDSTDRKRITKRTQKEVPRGLNKRRRAIDDERSCEIADMEKENTSSQCPSTPKRMRRIAPEVLPLGLERSDFHGLHLTGADTHTDEPFVFSAGRTRDLKNKEVDEEAEEEEEGGEWSTEEDRMLVELVLEKLKLSKSEWQDCARSLGKDKASVGRRWKSLMGAGEVGLKGRRRTRSGLHATWR
ncbi:hypothetical protein CJF31_00006598 [Rutstroemia sp. NJR-2017a BVV2]|nr:hypothetical protein CJF31_00006598 [Rutstroemia sp. NJR-2017a BVV2]